MLPPDQKLFFHSALCDSQCRTEGVEGPESLSSSAGPAEHLGCKPDELTRSPLMHYSNQSKLNHRSFCRLTAPCVFLAEPICSTVRSSPPLPPQWVACPRSCVAALTDKRGAPGHYFETNWMTSSASQCSESSSWTFNLIALIEADRKSSEGNHNSFLMTLWKSLAKDNQVSESYDSVSHTSFIYYYWFVHGLWFCMWLNVRPWTIFSPEVE